MAPNAISCNAAISACEKGGCWQLAVHLLRAMPKLGFLLAGTQDFNLLGCCRVAETNYNNEPKS